MYDIAATLARPLSLLLLAMGVSIVYVWRARKLSRRALIFITVPFIGLLVLSMPVTGMLLLGTLERRYTPPDEWPDDAQAIVVLAGDVRRWRTPEPGAELGPTTLLRCMAAARVYREAGPLPVVVSGGNCDASSVGPPASALMHDFLVQLGVPSSDVIMESRSTSTYGNALGCREILSQRDIRKVILVTDASHMHRSMLCFRRQAFEPVPAPCNYRAGNWTGPVYDYVLPSSSAFAKADIAAHEWLGIVWYRLHGRI